MENELIEFVTKHGPYGLGDRIILNSEAARTLCDCVPPYAVRVVEDPKPEPEKHEYQDRAVGGYRAEVSVVEHAKRGRGRPKKKR
jgi:hypothetical protein